MTDEEKNHLLETERHDETFEAEEEEAVEAFEHAQPKRSTRSARRKYRLAFSAGLNIFAAVGLVFANKRIFEDKALRHAQVTFTALHFAMTAGFLYTVSTPAIGMFERKKMGVMQILPLAVAVICSVVLTNASLAFSSIQFYQIMRVAVTPCVASMNWIVLRQTIPLSAGLMLIPVCIGVAVVSYFDTAAKPASQTHGTSPLGVFFALISLVATATYTVLIKKFHNTTDCKSHQLLLNQSPVAVLIMLYIIPFSDDVTVWHTVSTEVWMYIVVSGMLACLLHISQFMIIDDAGPISSTVVGHFKTCLIIAIGWLQSQRPLTDGSMVGIILALAGIVAYSVAMQRAAK